MSDSDSIIKLLENVGVDPDSCEEIDGYKIFDLYDYDNFNEVYNNLERMLDVEKDSDNSSLDIENAHIVYIYKDMLVELVAIFDDDNYSLNIFEGEN